MNKPISAVILLAQNTTVTELGKIILHKAFEERDTLNEQIVRSMNEAATDWKLKFLKCLHYEIAMEMQAGAERKRCSQILELEVPSKETQQIILQLVGRD